MASVCAVCDLALSLGIVQTLNGIAASRISVVDAGVSVFEL